MENVPEPRQAGPCQYCWGRHADEDCNNTCVKCGTKLYQDEYAICALCGG
jgi:hypothetical protein